MTINNELIGNKTIKYRNKLKLFMIILITITFVSRNYLASFQLIDTISTEFNREYNEGNKNEITKGKIYYHAKPEKLLIKVDHPICQWMILKGNETIIYYPSELQAFRIISQNPVSMPFFQAFIQVVKEDYGLSDFGYSFANFKREGNILISYWEPPKILSKLLGKFALKYEDNKLIYTEIKDAKGEILSKTYFKNHIIFGATYFPLEVSIVKNTRLSSTLETVIYKNPQFNSPIPQEIIAFKIPLDVKVKEVKW
jgi:outer membrane lipoprotein-sorting protein